MNIDKGNIRKGFSLQTSDNFLSIPGCQLWLDGALRKQEDFSGRISVWGDLSPFQRNFSNQAGLATKPINKGSYIEFNGALRQNFRRPSQQEFGYLHNGKESFSFFVTAKIKVNPPTYPVFYNYGIGDVQAPGIALRANNNSETDYRVQVLRFDKQSNSISYENGVNGLFQERFIVMGFVFDNNTKTARVYRRAVNSNTHFGTGSRFSERTGWYSNTDSPDNHTTSIIGNSTTGSMDLWNIVSHKWPSAATTFEIDEYIESILLLLQENLKRVYLEETGFAITDDHILVPENGF